MAKLGLCRDEYNRSDHWMSQLCAPGLRCTRRLRAPALASIVVGMLHSNCMFRHARTHACTHACTHVSLPNRRRADVRTALRMVGETVLTERDVVLREFTSRDDGIGLGGYTVDIPGPVQTIIDPAPAGGGQVVTEGALKVPTFCAPAPGYPNGIAPFALPYGSLLPRRGEVDNLLVPVALSASHVAFNSIRLEPTWMILGQSAGVAAAMAAAAAASSTAGKRASVRGVNVATLRRRLRELGQLLEPLPSIVEQSAA